MKKLLPLIITCIIIVITSTAFSQSNFNMDAYKQFLQTHQNMSYTDLMQMHPAGNFSNDLNLSLTNTRYLDSISSKFGLTAYELELLGQHGFVVSERMKKISFGES